MNRGEIWWAELPPPIGSRPVLLLSRNEALARRANITLAPLTTTVFGIDSEVLLTPADGVARESVVNLDNIGTFAKRYVQRHLTTLPPHKMLEVERAIHFYLALST